MQVNQAGINLIKEYEGLTLTTYTCSAGHFTIGYGHKITGGELVTNILGKLVRLRDLEEITQEQATELLKEDLKEAERYVNHCINEEGWQLNENQFSALVSFVYNVGHIGGTLRKALNAGDFKSAVVAMQAYNKVNGKPLAGLISRRKDEVELFNRR